MSHVAEKTERRFRTEIVLDNAALATIIQAEERMAVPVSLRADPTAISQHVAQAGLNNLKPWHRANQRIQENDMQQRIEEATGRHLPLNEDGSYHYLSLDDLPDTGRGDYPYKILSTGDMYRFRVDRYVPYNPYGAVPDDLRTAEHVVDQAPLMIIDESANMPHGGAGTMTLVWNVQALRRDLWTKGVRDWSFSDMMPKADRWKIQSHTTLAEQRSLYFRHSHRALCDQLRNEVRTGATFKKDYVEALERIGVELFIADKGMTGFKDGEFVAVFE